ncbi:hypothetical protein [Paenibacillus sp. 1P07SE]
MGVKRKFGLEGQRPMGVRRVGGMGGWRDVSTCYGGRESMVA